jgi:hypothetical protein
MEHVTDVEGRLGSAEKGIYHLKNLPKFEDIPVDTSYTFETGGVYDSETRAREIERLHQAVSVAVDQAGSAMEEVKTLRETVDRQEREHRLVIYGIINDLRLIRSTGKGLERLPPLDLERNAADFFTNASIPYERPTTPPHSVDDDLSDEGTPRVEETGPFRRVPSMFGRTDSFFISNPEDDRRTKSVSGLMQIVARQSSRRRLSSDSGGGGGLGRLSRTSSRRALRMNNAENDVLDDGDLPPTMSPPGPEYDDKRSTAPSSPLQVIFRPTPVYPATGWGPRETPSVTVQTFPSIPGQTWSPTVSKRK